MWVSMRTNAQLCCGVHVEVRRQFEEVGSLLVWVPGIEFRLSGVVANTFTCWAQLNF